MEAYMFREIKSHRGGRQDAEIVGKYIIGSKSMNRKTQFNLDKVHKILRGKPRKKALTNLLIGLCSRLDYFAPLHSIGIRP